MKTISAIEKISNLRQDLSENESAEVFEEIMKGLVDENSVSKFLLALKEKGESVSEVVGAARAMRRHAEFIDAGACNPIDTCGTGGDGKGTFNISTTSAFIVAGAGVAVAKHGNRAASGKCGSGDVLAALDFNLDVRPEVMEHCLQENGIAFLFAPKMHPSMKAVSDIRKKLGVRTIFNMLGPLLNPAGTRVQVVGVFEKSLTEFFAECLKRLGCKRAFVVHSYDGIDEISPCAPSRISELKNGIIKTCEFNPQNYMGLQGSFSDLLGGNAEENASKTLGILRCEISGAPRNACILNASAGIVASGKTENFKEAIKIAEKSLDDGMALKKLETLIKFSKEK